MSSAAFGDRIAIMKVGQLQQVAQPLELYNKPANLFVAEFIGSPPMSFMNGRIIKKEGKLYFNEGKIVTSANILASVLFTLDLKTLLSKTYTMFVMFDSANVVFCHLPTVLASTKSIL